MTRPPRSIIGTVAAWPVIHRPWLRRTVVVVLVAVFAVLTLFPERYRAAVTLTPADPATLGLAGTLGQQGAMGNLFGSALGNQTAIEVSLNVARSEYVRSIVTKQLDLERRLDKTTTETHRWLDRKVDIRSLRGGIIQFEIKQHDAQFARDIVAAYAVAVRQELATISRKQTELKRNILVDLVSSASDRLAKAQSAYDTFRIRNRYSSPQSAFVDAGNRIPEIEAQIRGKQVQLGAIRQFATDQNFRVQQTQAEIAALRRQLATLQSSSPEQRSSVGQVVEQTTELNRRYRELLVAQNLYENYRLFLQGTTVEDLSASANVRILEPPYIDTARQYNTLPLALALSILLIAMAIEFYQLRPPLSAVRDDD